GFSPNGDGINDVLVIPCAISSPVFLHIWNRWGSEIYRSSDYDNTWDGTYKGQLLPGGTYFYSLEYENPDQTKTRKAGYLAIYQ
ncbi:MAG TPA: gliding motility-associated C-terminal domain-containing protein, partial [Chitinophagaceae bacterium]|nr:gliding motility-associated C-terminal domain-containing protein [Chitinophagaceae bacterium]